MFSRRTQPIMEDIVSVFESTQNQPWSIFSGKLNRISIETCKNKNIFKSENPIQLSLKNDYRVFGLIPRLEEFKLLSCRKCKMIVKEDCLLHHYNRRHKSGNDTFSLRDFLRPTVNLNKHKRQKLNVRKLTKTKLMNGKIIDPVVQEIKSEFDELEFERLSKMKLEKLETKTNINYNDHNHLNFVIKTCSPVSSNEINFDFDWNLKPCTQSLVPCADNKIKECDVEPNKLSAEMSVDKDKLHCHKYGNVNNSDNINNIISSYDLLPKPLILNDEMKSNMLFNLASEDESKDESKSSYCILGGLLNNKNIKFTRDYNSDIVSDNKHISNVITHKQYSINLTIDEKINNPQMVNCQLDVINDRSSCDSITDLHPSLNNGDNLKVILSTKYSDVTSNKDENSEIDDSRNKCYQLLNNIEKTNYTSSDKCSDITNDKSFLNAVISNQSFTESSKSKTENTITYKEYLDIADENSIQPCQLSVEVPISKTLPEFLSCNIHSEGTSDKFTDCTVISNNSSSILPCSIKKVSKLKPSNEYTVAMFKECSDNVVTSYGKTIVSPFIDVIKSSNSSLLTNCKRYKVDDNYSNCSYREYYDTSKSVSDEEDNCKINEQFLNNYCTLPSELQNYNEKTTISSVNARSPVTNKKNSGDIFSIFDESTTSFLDNTEVSKPKSFKSGFDFSINMIEEDDDNGNSATNDKNECYYLSEFINSDVSSSLILSNYDYSDLNNDDSDDSVTSCDQSSVASLGIDDETHNLLSTGTYSSAMSDESFDSDTSQSISESLDVLKETKSIQTDLYLKHDDSESSIESMCKVGGSLLRLINDTDNNTDCTLTDTFVECKEVSENCQIPVNSNSNVEIVEDFINNYTANSSCDKMSTDAMDNYTPVKSSDLASESSVDGFTSVNSSAKIINNTTIPIKTEKYKEKYELIDNDAAHEHDTSNNSHNTSYFQQIPCNPVNQNDHLTHSPIIHNNATYSESCADKQNDDIIHHDTIESLYHPIFKECLKKATDEKNIAYSRNYKIDNTVPKLKNNLKRRYAVKVADDKENHKLWKYGTFKKRHRLEFVVRKIICPDESDYNVNVSE